jgi:sugar/nucleoside kinase (ribokinase family)
MTIRMIVGKDTWPRLCVMWMSFYPTRVKRKGLCVRTTWKVAVTRLAEIVPTVVIKMGTDGAMAQRGNERIQSPAQKVDFVDPVGAGDSFDAGFLHQFVRKADLHTCLASGNRAGAFSTTRAGGTEAFRDHDLSGEVFGGELAD